MERTIIKIEPEWNNAHCSLEGVDYDLSGWAELPSAFRSVWAAYRPFVDLTADDTGAIIDMVQGMETGPDLAPVAANKLEELSQACNAAILAGCDVTLPSGSTGHIALTNEDQINLTNAVGTVEAGVAQYPYHLDGELCAMYPAADILAMGTAATAHKLYHTTYYNHLAAWVKRCETAAEVQAIVYGSELPVDLAQNMSAILAAVSHV